MNQKKIKTILRQPFLKAWRKILASFGWGSVPLGVAESARKLMTDPAGDHGISMLREWAPLPLPRKPARFLPEDGHPYLADESPLRQLNPWVAVLHGAEVHGPSIGVTTRSRLLLKEVSIEWSHLAENHGLMRRFFLPPAIDLRGRILLLATTGGDNYFHWMMDVLPRIEMVQKVAKSLKKFDRIVINSGQTNFQKESLAQFAIRPDQCVKVNSRVRYRCEELWVPSLPSLMGYPTARNVRFLQRAFLGGKPFNKGRRILIGREPGKSRQTKGWDEVRKILISRGFKEIQPGKLPIRQQARIFAEAEWVVGIHGAALTNLAFCRPGTRVVEILGWDYVNPCYRALSDAAGLHYHALIGGDWSSSPVTRLDRPEAPIRLEAEKTRRFFRHIGLI